MKYLKYFENIVQDYYFIIDRNTPIGDVIFIVSKQDYNQGFNVSSDDIPDKILNLMNKYCSEIGTNSWEVNGPTKYFKVKEELEKIGLVEKPKQKEKVQQNQPKKITPLKPLSTTAYFKGQGNFEIKTGDIIKYQDPYSYMINLGVVIDIEDDPNRLDLIGVSFTEDLSYSSVFTAYWPLPPEGNYSDYKIFEIFDGKEYFKDYNNVKFFYSLIEPSKQSWAANSIKDVINDKDFYENLEMFLNSQKYNL